MKIALDAMGGDFAPASEVEGAVMACREFGAELILVGDEKKISEELKKQNAADCSISI
ncbi:MAG TPA: phosphate--acyl-ACP acyltransferase, partial [Nitrospiria bacterium]|nr:phosphate--acyl-ACP acyltransferase [Nitrospiria bacterium]